MTTHLTYILSLLLILSGCHANRSSDQPEDVHDTHTPPQDIQEEDRQASCPRGFAFCGNICANTATDPQHCGACDHQCSPIETCLDGMCQTPCEPDETLCDNNCVLTISDPLHCGTCNQVCDQDHFCEDGVCQSDCPEPLLICDELCINPTNNLDHCGQCNTTCGIEESCLDGICTPDCPEGFQKCSEVCTNLQEDILNCGDCGNTCLENQACDFGECIIRCMPEMYICGDICIDLTSNRTHCGECEHSCADDEICNNGTCEIHCDENLSDCHGLCVDLLTDPVNCGACGATCENNELCTNGDCIGNCPEGFDFCETECINFSDDPNNCGGCGIICSDNNNCERGQCHLVCPERLTNCGNNCVNLDSDRLNCGTCEAPCSDGFLCTDGTCTEPDTFSSCLEILTAYPNSQSGSYTIYPEDLPSVEVTCDMESNGGGWTQLINWTINEDCPDDWINAEDFSACVRDLNEAGVRSTLISNLNIEYAQIRGYLKGVQFNSTDAFGGRNGEFDLESHYVDGVSLTWGTPRHHIWTYAAGMTDDTSLQQDYACPCRGGALPPEFVGGHFYCESGNPELTKEPIWYDEDPLWNGNGFLEDCSSPGDPSWFTRTLSTPLNEPIEARLSANQASYNEEPGITEMVLLIREFEVCDQQDNDYDGLVDEAGACPSTQASSCKQILAQGGRVDNGVYWIAPPGIDPLRVYCDMSHDDGGWTLALVCRPHDPTCWNTDAIGTCDTPDSSLSTKLSDDVIQTILDNGDQTTRSYWRQIYLYDEFSPTSLVTFNVLDTPTTWSSEGCGEENLTFSANLADADGISTDIHQLSAQAYASETWTMATQSTDCACAANGWSNLSEDGCGLAAWMAFCEEGPSMSHCCSCTQYEERSDVVVWIR